MAGGPISFTAYPQQNGNLFPWPYVGGGGNAAPTDVTLGVIASLPADSAWQLRAALGPVISTGTLKLRLLALASATSGKINFTVADAAVSPAASPSGATLTNETSSSWTSNPSAAGGLSGGVYSLTWAAGYTDQYIEMKIPLSISLSANQMVVMALTMKTSGWTLAVRLGLIPTLIWE